MRRGNAANLKQITLGILSWKAFNTIRNTLDSFKTNGLLDLVTTKLYCQEKGADCQEISTTYGIELMGSDINTGLARAFIEMVEGTTTPYFLFSENDFVLTRSKEETERILQDSIELLEKHGVNVVKLRHREKPGDPYLVRMMPENVQNILKLEMISNIDDPESAYPGVFTKVQLANRWFICDDSHNKWSNNNFIAKTDWLREKVLPVVKKGLEDKEHDSDMMEMVLIRNLRGYRLAAGPGLFTHERLDR